MYQKKGTNGVIYGLIICSGVLASLAIEKGSSFFSSIRLKEIFLIN